MGEGFLVQPGRGAGRQGGDGPLCPNGFLEWPGRGQVVSRGPPSCVPPSSCAPRACGDAWERPIIRFLNRVGQRVSPPTRFSLSDRLPAARCASPVMPLSPRCRQWTGGSRVAGQIAWKGGGGLVCLSAGEGGEWLPWTQRTCRVRSCPRLAATSPKTAAARYALAPEQGGTTLAPPSPKQKESGAARQPRSPFGALKAP